MNLGAWTVLAATATLFCLLMFLASCSPPPEQPDLNTYGVLQPLCVLGCTSHFTLTEGDGAGSLTSSVSSTSSTTRNPTVSSP